MAGALPVVDIFGVKNINLESKIPCPKFETSKLDCRCYLTDDDVFSIIAKDRPSAIVSFGQLSEFPNLNNMPFEYRKKWIHFNDTDDLQDKGVMTFNCILADSLKQNKDVPLVSVFTPSYKTGNFIYRPYNSLVNQNFNNWEWIIVDDSDDDGANFKLLSSLADSDPRIRVYREHRHSGNIGRLKKTACSLSNGEYLLELDHDDELMPNAILDIVSAYEKHSDVGFLYSDFAECFEDGRPVVYGENWGHGYGSYRQESHGGMNYMVVNSPNINPKTIRHIVAAPNHFRCWRTKTYFEIGGHSDRIHVADDYEIIVRSFLNTRMGRVPNMNYIQYRNEIGNTHRERNKEIQRLVRYFSSYYDEKIHERFQELGIYDFVYEKGNSFYRLNTVENPKVEQHCTVWCR